MYATFLAFPAVFIRPDAALRLTHMGLVEQNHAQSALPDAATDAQRKRTLQQPLVEVELFAVLLALQSQLALQGLRVHTDTHAAQLHGTVKHRVPHQQVTIEPHESVLIGRTPIVIVGRTQIVLLSVFQFAADADDKHSPILLAYQVFALLGRSVGIKAPQLLAVDKMHLLGKIMLELGISLADIELRA